MFRRPKLSDIGAEESRTTITEFFANRGGRFVLVIAVACAVVAIGLGAWPWDYLRDATTIETVRNIVISAAVPPSVFMALWRASVAQQNAESARRNADTAHRDAETSRRAVHNERYQNSVEMLGNSSVMVRLGGIHALLNLALESKIQKPSIFELLSAFVRYPPHRAASDGTSPSDVASTSTVPASASGRHQLAREDVASALEAVVQLAPPVPPEPEEDWRRLNLRGANLAGGAIAELDLRYAYLPWAVLTDAEFQDVELESAILTWANLDRAIFRIDAERFGLKTMVNFKNTMLHSASLVDARLFEANLENAILIEAKLMGCRLEQSVLIGTRFIGADLTGACLADTNMEGAELSGAVLSGVDFVFSEWFTEIVDDGHGPEKVYGYSGSRPARGLTQAQLDEAVADPRFPPKLDGVLDADTGLQLTWDRFKQRLPDPD